MDGVLSSRQNYENYVSGMVKSCGRSVMSVPGLEKIVVSSALGLNATDKNYMVQVEKCFGLICGQKCLVVKAKKSVASFKVREGMLLGVKTTLRKSKMYDFLDFLVYVVLPRVKDFKGFSVKSIDENGRNFTVGIKDCMVFPQIEYGMISKSFGFNINFVFRGDVSSKDEIIALLKSFNIPVR